MRISKGASALYTAGVGLLNADWLQQANALQRVTSLRHGELSMLSLQERCCC